ncbi:putative spermidine/putrescine transport system permease protein [Geosporobacter subterraneus DSM 17957]|uniref:Putative spermidine/putrescine transport system permease protein n=2 Tax=Geosporobacter TaxID=390805 RepID=A0A1M6BWZ2_9FIRM|nr:putative spermidine/putrescine transport system permease protein [Geosporobacter subterraneus DSM 17957]
MALAQSLGYFPVVGLRNITLFYYREVLRDSSFLTALAFSLYTSFVSSLFSVGIGVLLSYLLIQKNNSEKLVSIFYKLPIIVPHTVAVLLMLNIFFDSGILARLFYHLDLIQDSSQFSKLVFDKRGFGIIITYIWKEVPFITMVVYTVMSKINSKLADAAANLGANRRQIFIHVLLPLLLPTISSAFIIIFAFSFGAFEVPYLIGPTFPKALPVMAYINYIHPDMTNRPYTMVILMCITFICILLTMLYTKLFNLILQYDR